MNILLKNGYVIDPANQISKKLDVGIKDSKITHIQETLPKDAYDLVIDVSNQWVVPGFIDLHVHVREPGQTHKEDIYSGSQAAVAGGFTTICTMPNTNPVQDSTEIIKFVLEKASHAVCHVLPVGAITKNQEGNILTNFAELKKAGICALSEDGKSVESAYLMREALIKATKENLVIMSHCEDPSMTGGTLHESELSKLWNLPPVLRMAEDVITARDILLALDTHAPLHICHVSTKGAVSMIRQAKSITPHITAEVTPHHFVLSIDDIKEKDANYKMSPPLREPSDIEAIIKGLQDNTIEVIATDHAPHHADEKAKSFEKAPNGIIGLETALPLAMTYLYHTGHLSKEALIEKFTSNPAKVLSLDKGSLSIGHMADITIIDPNEKYHIDKNTFFSKARNTPFHNYSVTGKVKMTLVNGKIVYNDKE